MLGKYVESEIGEMGEKIGVYGEENEDLATQITIVIWNWLLFEGGGGRNKENMEQKKKKSKINSVG